MSWLPAFKLGLWNAWILMLVYILHPLILLVVDKIVGSGNIFTKMGDVPTGEREKRDNLVAMVISCLLIAYSVFLPLKAGTAWFYAGIAIWLAGLVIILTSIVNVAATPAGQVFTKGTYRYSRHPLYISVSMIFLGVGVASASWVFMLLTVIYISLQNSQADAEEQSCLNTYGEKYKEYMNSTPRWIGIPKSR
jgi:protein-S-isoprenylcysteine O-methyltransferase Ste14